MISNIIPIKKLKISICEEEKEKELEVRWVKALTGRKGWVMINENELVLRMEKSEEKGDHLSFMGH